MGSCQKHLKPMSQIRSPIHQSNKEPED
uniref:Uncharacterized protein n=1 Tax=Anguilla anguilla TaxID=7936 RepID=A0A0E9RVJ8_ANGAN